MSYPLSSESALELYHSLGEVRQDVNSYRLGLREQADVQEGLRLLAWQIFDAVGWPDAPLEDDDGIALAEGE